MDTGVESFRALLHHLFEGIGFLRAVDKDRPDHPQRPAKQRQIRQLSLHHLHVRVDEGGQHKGLPGALVLAQNHVAAAIARNVLGAFHFAANARNPTQAEHAHAAVDAHDPEVTGLQWQQHANQHGRDKPEDGNQRQPDVEQHASQLVAERLGCRVFNRRLAGIAHKSCTGLCDETFRCVYTIA